MSAGQDYNCAIKTDDSIFCWGINPYGQATPPTGNNFKQISAGEKHACAVKTNGGIVCWAIINSGRQHCLMILFKYQLHSLFL
ncbi:hypothetical membrane protein [Beggiatoa sp. PS]|nr:hypothetical membrane protein [Beggiatoa sp. PS]